jgi:hypothetical protein
VQEVCAVVCGLAKRRLNERTKRARVVTVTCSINWLDKPLCPGIVVVMMCCGVVLGDARVLERG